MRHRTILAVIGVGVALTACASAPAEPTISAARIAEGIATISTDEYGGRLPGSAGEALTLAWLQAQYEAMPGVEPGGPDGRWVQPVDIRRFRLESAEASWSGPDGEAHPVALGTDMVLRSPMNDGRADIQHAGVVFAGYGIHAPERGWDDYGDIDVTGRVVVVIRGEPEGDRFNGAYETVYATGFHKQAEAFRRGAAGVLMVAPPSFGDWRWCSGPVAAPVTQVPGIQDMELCGSVTPELTAEWLTAAGLDAGTLTPRDGFRAVALPGVALTAQVRDVAQVQRSYNLLARIPGSARPDETVLYSAHWDHVGEGHPGPDGDAIYNGAWDNASGTVGVVELARVFATGPRPERSVVFAHVTAEEQGLLGAFWYAANPVWPLETTVADINIDMLPLSAPTRDIAIFGKGQTTLEDELAALAEVEGRYLTDDREPEQNYYYRSDHFPYALRGVPALMPWHGVDLDDGGTEVGLPAYQAFFRERYHRPADEWDPSLDLSSAVENLTLLYRLGRNLADSDRWPGWKPGSEFAATRAASDAARE